jgi:cell division protein FtsI (penicillin-binding protein 3)
VEPKVVRRAVSAETALEMLPILEAVVERGTAKAAHIPGFTIAGKTGTADKLVNGRYVGHMQNVSFLGFVPSRDPVLTIIVMVDTPRVGSDTGGAVSAPIFKRIAEAALRHLGIPPNLNPPAPVVVAAQREPSPVTPTASTLSVPAIVMLAGGGADDASLVPDLRGMSARDALRTLAKLGMGARLRGKGLVVEQTPAAGTPLDRGVTCTLVLEREVPRAPAVMGAHP